MNLEGVDLFAGAGGTSTGILEAVAALKCRMNLLAVNHWTTAVNTHSLNHPDVRHLCESVENITPSKVVPGRHLNILAGSPECTYHSNAAGGRPCNEQSRATAWHICRWASDLVVDNILIENVPEFKNWAPLLVRGITCRGKYYRKNRPDPRRKGETFKAFMNALFSLGFNPEMQILNAADYGDPTNRRRLIIMARRGKKIVWPTPSHGIGCAAPFRTAREIIDWDMKGKSIFDRKKPLSPNTIRRIAAGLKKFGGVNAAPFLVMLYGTNDVRSLDRPLATVTSGGNHIGLAEPFITHLTHHGERKQHSINDPLPTVTGAHRGELALIEPFIVTMEHGGGIRSSDRPLPTITTAKGGAMAVVEPFLVKYHGNHEGREDGDNRVHTLDNPLATVDTSNRMGLCEPFVVKYYGTASANTLNAPLDTVTTKDRFLLVEPTTGKTVAELDILFRMLQPRELASAMSFPLNYQFTGTREDQVKQIGNAVPVKLARACAMQLLS